MSPLAPLVGWSHAGGPGRKLQFDFLTNEMWPGNYLWGYLFSALAVAMLPLGLLACAVGYSRIHTGVHYPGDVIAGAVLGTGAAATVLAATRHL